MYRLNWLMFQSVRRWLRRRFSVAGRFILAALLLSGAVGIDTNQTMAYMAFTLLLSLLILSRLHNFFFHTQLTIQRQLPRLATAGEPLKYRVMIENRASQAQKALVLLEDLESPLPTRKEIRELTAAKVEGSYRAYWKLGRRRWLWLLSRKKPAQIKEHILPTLLPHRSLQIPIELLPQWRGRLHFNGLTVSCPDPFGLTKADQHIPISQSLMVLPKRYTLPLIQLPGMRRHHPGGVSLAAAIGESEEFYALREYRPGDPLRKIHWKSWAHTAKPIVKEHQDEFFVRHALILDTFQPWTYSAKLEESVSIAASFVYSLETQESLLDLMFVGDRAFCFTTGRGLAHNEQILEILASVQACTNKTFSALQAPVLERASLLSGCICVLLDWDAERIQLIERLRKLGKPVLALVLADDQAPASRDPGPLRDDPANLRFIEMGKVREGLSSLS